MRYLQLTVIITLASFISACTSPSTKQGPTMTEASSAASTEDIFTPAKTPLKLSLSNIDFNLPAGWIVTQKTASRIHLVSNNQKASIVIICSQSEKKLSHKDFSLLATAQFETEKNNSVGLVKGIPPDEEFVYYGGPRATGRVFAGYMRPFDKNLILVVGDLDDDDPKKAMKMVSDFIQRLINISE